MKRIVSIVLTLSLLGYLAQAQNGIVVIQTDFGTKDGAVSAMKGVALGVSPQLKLVDLTHEIPAYNIWEAAYRLVQTAPYYPKGTVFVSVCDPGVGTERKSVMMKSKSGHFFVTPDNGTLTLVAEQLGIAEVREINEAVNRRKNSKESYTFHGRDVYAYTAARLAAKAITYAQVGRLLPAEVVKIPYQQATLSNNQLSGNIPVLDVQYGNVWSNIPKTLFDQLHIQVGDKVRVQIFHQHQKQFDEVMVYANTFGQVPEGQNLAYFNSLMNFSVAVNMGNFSEKYKVFSGADWFISVEGVR